MSRFYISPENIKDGQIYVSGKEAHHILDVMRLKRNDEVIAFDGLGNEYRGRISDTKEKTLVISILERLKKNPLAVNIALAQAIPKRDKMDYIVEKCTELGVRSMIPMITERTVVRMDKTDREKRRARWIRIAEEASKQCGRSDIPEIKNILSFEDAVKSTRNYNLKLIPSLIGERKELKCVISNKKISDAVIFIGPEGDFNDSELKLALLNGFCAVSLGPLTLKSDTAAIAAVSILNYALNYA